MSPILGIIASQDYPRVTSSYESIATATGTGSNTYVEFTSIPSTYTHLQIRITGQPNNTAGGGATLMPMRLNGDTAANYSIHYLVGNGTAASAAGGASTNEILIGYIPQGGGSSGSFQYIFNATVVDILDYQNTSKYKTVRSLSGFDKNGTGFLGLFSGNWRNTNAITSIRIYPNDGFTLSWGVNSQISLYGIKGA